ncbi:hypothetical protein AMAG_02517 [Allomyces macrogynus ATCC 38327]|uniref:Uncharacterized protein n=1 Tax=Allomyces macrogynus (strain ATCC 38327) TaxID=578462 RepID=A0A0L0S2C4_ALLM3|nr:hypothetical protein AMAG_02517 [Allomyces macrogynus ATCC 38327]|eukprot:KNE56737.1 hypothetical protein AMAG_02517 [Allomyces macrogynus ATCC 38327]
MAPSPPSPPVMLEPSDAELLAPAPMALDALPARELPRRPSILLPLTPSALFAASKAGAPMSGPPSPTPSPSPPLAPPRSPSAARVPSDFLARDPVSIAPHLPAPHAPAADTTARIADSSAGAPVPVAPPRANNDVLPLSSSAQSPPTTPPPAAAARLWSLTAPAIPLPAFSAAPAWRRSPPLAASRSTPRSIRAAAAAAAARHHRPSTPHTPSSTARRTPARSGRGTSRVRTTTPRSARIPPTSPSTTDPLSPYLVTSTAFASNSLIHARVPDHLGVVVVPPPTSAARRTPIVVVPPRYSRISTAPIRADVYRAGKRRQQHAEAARFPPPKSPDVLPDGYLPSPTATSSPPPEPVRGRKGGTRVAARASESADWLDEEEVDLGMGDSDSDFDLEPVGMPRDDVAVDMFDDDDDGYGDSTWALPGAATEATPLLGGKPSSSSATMGKPSSASPTPRASARRTHGTLSREPSSLSVFSGAGPMRLLILVAALVAVTAFVLLAVLVVYASTHPLVGFTITVQSVTSTAHDAFKMHLNVTGHNKNYMADVVLRQETPLRTVLVEWTGTARISGNAHPPFACADLNALPVPSVALGPVTLHKHKNHFTFPPARTAWWRVAADIKAPLAAQESEVWRRYRAGAATDRQYYLVIAGEYTYTLAWTRHMVEPVCVVHVAPPPKGKNATAMVV